MINLLGKGSVSSFLTVLLNVGWYGAALGLALTSVLVVLTPVLSEPDLRLTIPVSFSLDTRAHRVAAPSPGGADVQVGVEAPGFAFEIVGEDETEKARIGRVTGSLRFPTRSKAFFAGNAAFLAVFLALMMFVLGQLRAVFRTTRDGQPFVRPNATRIRWIAYTVIVGEVARSALVSFESYYAMTHFSAEGLRFSAWPDVNAFAIIHGLTILVIAEVFRAGTRLDDEQSLTV